MCEFFHHSKMFTFPTQKIVNNCSDEQLLGNINISPLINLKDIAQIFLSQNNGCATLFLVCLFYFLVVFSKLVDSIYWAIVSF